MTLDRAYSLLEVKSLDDETRIIRGIASTPTVDRMGDVVEPLGARFKTPMPLFLHHDSEQTVGYVTFAAPTAKGIPFEAHLPVIAEAGRLKDRIDEAWQMVKYKLITAVSIGFKPVKGKVEQMKAGGLRFLEWDWLELSLVPIPANGDATISYVKALDRSQLAALGLERRSVVRLDALPGASGDPAALAIQPSQQGIPMRTIQETISAFEAKRAATAARMSTVIEKSATDGSTLDAETKAAYQADSTELAEIDDHLAMLKTHSQQIVARATPIVPGAVATPAAAADARGGVISVKPNVEKGTAFARYVQVLSKAKGNLMQAAEMAKQYDDSTPEVSLILRAAVAAGTTTDAAWAAPLVPYNNMTAEFMALLRPATIIGRIPGLRKVPFNIKMPTQTGGSSVGWVGQGAAKPVSALAFGNLTLDFTKTAGIVVISEELARLSTPAAEGIIRQDLTDQIALFQDQSFVNPALAAVAGVSPASITNGATAIAASGTTADALRSDIRRLMATFTAANMSSGGAVFIMTETQATALAMMVNTLGQPEFPGITATGGTLFGLPVVTSEAVTQNTAGSPPVTTSLIILVKASEILLADDGGVTIDVSREASLQMDSAPTTPPTAATVMVSLWQMNLVGIRAERWINWVRRRPGSVAYISNANYTSF